MNIENPTSAVYDLSRKLFISGRLFRAPLERGYVLFNPDFYGLPIVAADWVVRIMDGFVGGAHVGAVLGSLPETVHLGDSLDVIEYLEDHGFLRASPTPERYTAAELGSEATRGIGIWLHVNNHCNLDCEYCFVQKSKSTMSSETVAQTVEYIRSTVETRNLTDVLVKFAGGEPTLALATMEDFHARLCAALQPLGTRLRFGVLSNGTILFPRLLEFLKRAGATMAISLDGFGAATHDIYRVYKGSRKGSWDRILANIEVLKSNRIPISINATISERSCPSLPQLLKWIVENRFRTRLGIVRSCSPSFDSETERFSEVMAAAFDAALTEVEKPQYRLDLRYGIAICELHFDVPMRSACCGIAANHVVFQDDGQLASCPMTIREEPVPAGRDLLTAVRTTFRHTAAERDGNSESNCLDCQWFPVCASGCPVMNLRVKGTAFTTSSLDPFYKFVIPRYVMFVGRKLLQEADRNGVGAFGVLDVNSCNSKEVTL